MSKSDKDQVKTLLDDIERILKRQGKTIADLARDLGKNYNQVYHWIRLRRFDPGGQAILRLKQWRDVNYLASL
jgi:hypothetical protein